MRFVFDFFRGRTFFELSSGCNMPALTSAKIALWNTMLAQNVGKAELARRLGVNRVQVDRLVDLLHGSKIEAVEHALAILGQRLAVTVIAA